MRGRFRALLVHDQERPMVELKLSLEEQGITTLRARGCAEARAAMASPRPPALIFTDSAFSDGAWADIQALAETVRPAVPVIVVSRFVDIPLYLEALERGAADFIVPPFRDADVQYVVEGALLGRTSIPCGFSRTTPDARAEVTQHAQDHTGSGVRAAHAQAGR